MTELHLTSNNYYKVDPLYQWDQNQELKIYGVTVNQPIIHFTNNSMGSSINRRPTVDSAGVLSVMIPNSLLQKSEPITAYICGYIGETFKTFYKLEISVKARKKPGDYTLEVADDEVYSFTALDRKVADAVSGYESAKNYFDNAVDRMAEIENTYKINDNKLADYINDSDAKFTEYNETLEEHLQLIETAKTYRIPWNVDENVGKIVVEPFSLECSAKGSSQASISKEFVFKNSGTVRVGFSRKLEYSNSINRDNTWYKLYVNDKLIKSLDANSWERGASIPDSFDLTINNGDIFKIELSAHCKGPGSTDSVDVSISDFCLYANIETPYTYQTLTEDLDSVTAEEVLNTLLGV